MREEVSFYVVVALVALAAVGLFKVLAGGPLSAIAAVRRFDDLISSSASPTAPNAGR